MHPKLPEIVGASGIFLFLFGFVGTIYLFPMIIDSQIHANIDLKEGTMGYDMWKKPPFPLKFKVYFFNVTNTAEIQQGALPIVKEHGPYIYDLYIERLDVELLEDKDVLKYMLRKYYYFNKAESAPLDEDDIVTMLHPSMVGMVMQVNRTLPTALGVVQEALPHLFPGVKDIFITDKVRNILFDGITILCGDPAAEFLCSVMKTDLPMTVHQASNGIDFIFSLFNYLNGSVYGPWEMERGLKNTTRGEIRSVRMKEALDLYEEDSTCNMINGSDTTVFAIPDEVRADRLYAYIREVCRSLYLNYEKETEEFGMKAARYTNKAGVLNYDSGEMKCFCPILEDDDGEEQFVCPPNGVFDLGVCHKAPILLSFPHYYLGDPKLRQYVKAMNPKKELHETYVHLEPTTATPLSGMKRVQLNIQVAPVPDFPLMDNITPGIFPLVWMDEGVVLPDDIIHIMTMNFLLIKLVGILKVVLMIGGLGLCAAGVVLMLKNEELMCFSNNSTSKVTAVDRKYSTSVHSTPRPQTVEVVNPAFEGPPRNGPRTGQRLPPSRAGSNRPVLNNNRNNQWNVQVWHSGESAQ